MGVVLEAKEKLLTVREAAERLDVAPCRIRNLIREGRIRGIKIGRDWLIPESEVRRYDETRRPYRKR